MCFATPNTSGLRIRTPQGGGPLERTCRSAAVILGAVTPNQPPAFRTTRGRRMGSFTDSRGANPLLRQSGNHL